MLLKEVTLILFTIFPLDKQTATETLPFDFLPDSSQVTKRLQVCVRAQRFVCYHSSASVQIPVLIHFFSWVAYKNHTLVNEMRSQVVVFFIIKCGWN